MCVRFLQRACVCARVSLQVVTCYLLKILTTYAMSNFPLRVTLHFLLFGETEATAVQNALETLVPFLVALLAGLLVTNVGFLFSFVGAVARSAVFFMYPCALYLRCSAVTDKGPAVRAACYALFGFGAVIMLLGVWSSLASVL